MTRADYASRFSRWLSARVGKQNGMTRRRLAEIIGVDPSSVSWWTLGKYNQGNRTCAGEPALPSREHTIAIAKALGQPVDLVLLLTGHAPEMDPERAYRLLRPSPMEERKAVAL